MKITRYIVIVAGIVAVFAAIAWLLRNDLIQRLSNPLLKDYGITIVDVSLDALASSDATISYLKLVHEKGTTIVIDDLTLPYAATSKRSKTYRARKVSVITATRAEGEAFDVADLIRQVLSLPNNVADSVFVVGELSLAPYPSVRDVRWELTDRQQRLDGTVESIAMSATASRKDSNGHDMAFSVLSGPATVDAHTLTASLLDDDQQLRLSGTNPIDLPTWQPLSELAGLVPTELEIVSGTATLRFDMTIPNDATQTPTLTASLTPTSVLQFDYRGAYGDTASVVVQSAGISAISATFPDVDWSLELAQASLTVSYGEWTRIPLSLGDVSCKAGPVCSMKTRVAIGGAQLPIGKVALLEYSSIETLHFPDSGVRVDVHPGASLKLKDLKSQTGGLKSVLAQLVSTAALDIDDTGWRLSADSVDANIENLILGDDIAVSMPLFLERVIVGATDDKLSLKSGVYAPSSRAAWDQKTIVLPGFKGTVSLQDTDAAADLRTVGLQQDAAVEARHNLASGTGRMNADRGTVSFAKTGLSDRVSPWPDDRDIVSGTALFKFSANWARKKSQLLLTGDASVTATKLAGYYGDTAFTGLSTQLSGTFQDGAGFRVEPSTVTAALVEIGVPLENLTADYTLDLNALSVEVANLRVSAFGGVVTADPFSFRTDRDVNTLTLNTESLDLTELLSLKGFESVEVTGSVNARLPVSIEGDSVTIENGFLAGNAPGGVIRYKPASPPDKSDVSSFGFAKRVLGNFEYKTLASDVNLSKEGDLVLKLKLTGRNPDLDEKRPVVLNLGVENNIPQMLRSLRAARAVEDVLERRLGR